MISMFLRMRNKVTEMVVLSKFWTFLFILTQLLMSCVSFREKNYDIERNKQILNNQLDSFCEIESIISCGRKCTENDKCDGASFDEKTSVCTLHFDNIFIPMEMGSSVGIWSMTDKVKRVPIDLRIDVNTLNSTRKKQYVSPDQTILSMELTSQVKAWSTGAHQMTTFWGVITDYCVGQGQMFLYDITVYPNKPSYPHYDIEICIGVKSTLDNKNWCGTYESYDSWMFEFAFEIINSSHIHYYICVLGKALDDEDEGFIRSPDGTATFSVFVDRVNNVFSVFSKDSLRLIYSITGVFSNVSLYPAFISYHNTAMKILRAFQIT